MRVWLAGAAVVLIPLGAAAGETGIVVRDAWARAVGVPAASETGGNTAAGHGGNMQAREPAGAAGYGNGAVYLTLENRMQRSERLVRATTPVAAAVELHETQHDGQVMRMRPVEAIEIPAGGGLTMKPGGYHVMLMGLKQPLEPGSTVPLTLEFASGMRMTLDVPVRSR